MIALLLVARALAAGVSLAPSTGLAASGPREPAWAVFGAPRPGARDFGALSRELDAAWNERRALDNGTAEARVDALVAALRPVIDVGERDLLQRALFLSGVLQIDDAGGIEAIQHGIVVVNGQRIPEAWAQAISLSPGAPAPATADAAYAVQIYEQARTTLTQAGGLALDPSAPGVGEVRVDGLPVSQEITLLPGEHTLSWHPVGADPVVLELSVGPGDGFDAERLKTWLAALTRVQHRETELDPGTRAELHAALASPALVLGGAGSSRVVWLVDGDGRWGRPALGLGAGLGVWGLVGTDGPAVACDGTVSSPDQALAEAAIEGSLTVGPWRLRAGGGAAHALGGGFAATTADSCESGLSPGVELLTTIPWGWASAGRRFGLSAGNELEPFLRVGGTGTHALAQVGVTLRLRREPMDLDLRLAAGPAFNVWSSAPGAHLALVGGLETVLSFGRK